MKTIQVPVVHFLGETTIELEGEFDLRAQAVKIDRTSTEIVRFSSQTGEDRVLLSGAIRLDVVFVNEIDRTLREASTEIPFSKSIEATGVESGMPIVLEEVQVRQVSLTLVPSDSTRTTHFLFVLVLLIKFKVVQVTSTLYEEPNPNIHHLPGGGA